ncbi:protein FAR1-RELATED SEQUENCE 3-like [Vicia villosa]|uniref:protein FAR1-RELATED SEQUENCE 3-like n=1 Tax=Vicia villosa TaxID=3911 RepID=UPI00273BCFE1|nr:protein FAR1-RELATED SEQUENCE 3-like [Vicia villosa]
MVHPDNIVTDELVVPDEVNIDDRPNEPVNDVKTITVVVDVRPQFTNDMTFACREHLLDWVRNKASKLGFGIVILRFDNGSSRRKAFVVLNCERGGKYVRTNRVLKHNDTGSRKCACSLKLRVSRRIDRLWRFSDICGVHNHALETNLHGNSSTCWLSRKEKDVNSELSKIKVAPRNIFMDLKQKKPDSVSNIKQVYNKRYNLKVMKMGPRSEMQHLLKLLGDNQYVSSFRTCEDKVTVRNIFWTNPESIKLFSTFLTVLIIDSMYKTNKYRLPLLEIIGVTSTDKTYSVGFSFLECEKEDNFTWALEICKNLLVDQKNVPSIIVTDRDNALMNTAGTVFLTSTALLCRYHITCNVRTKLKLAVGTKERKDDNRNIIKVGVMVDKIMAAWREILDARSKELYTEKVIQFRTLCVSLNTFFHYVETKRAETTGPDSLKCGCTIRKTYGLPCACILSKEMKLNSPIHMNEVNDHWKKLSFDEFQPTKESDSKITISDELEEIMDKIYKADDTMKLHIKEQFRKIAFPETTDLKPPYQPLKTKGAPKTPKSSQDDTSTKRDPSYCEHVDALILDSPTPKSKCSGNKRARISKPPRTPPIKKPLMIYIDEMPLFMHKYIDNIVHVGSDGNYGYRAVAGLLGKGEDNHTLI